MSARKAERWEVVNARRLLRDGTQLSAYLYSPFASNGIYYWAVRHSDGDFDGGEASSMNQAKRMARQALQRKHLTPKK